MAVLNVYRRLVHKSIAGLRIDEHIIRGYEESSLRSKARTRCCGEVLGLINVDVRLRSLGLREWGLDYFPLKHHGLGQHSYNNRLPSAL